MQKSECRMQNAECRSGEKMATLEDAGDDEVRCSDCDKQFTLIWQREYEGERVEYCPFCGAEFDE